MTRRKASAGTETEYEVWRVWRGTNENECVSGPVGKPREEAEELQRLLTQTVRDDTPTGEEPDRRFALIKVTTTRTEVL